MPIMVDKGHQAIDNPVPGQCSVQMGDHTGEHRRARHHVVGAQEQDPIPARPGDGLVPGIGDTGIRLGDPGQHVSHALAQALQAFQCPVLGSAVRDDHLEVRIVAFGDAAEATLDRAAGIQGGHDDRDPGRGIARRHAAGTGYFRNLSHDLRLEGSAIRCRGKR